MLVGQNGMKAAVKGGLASVAPLMVLTQRALAELIAEVGSADKAARWLMREVARYRKPVGVNLDAEHRTVFQAPPGWTEEKLQGYVAAHKDEIEREFGDITRVTLSQGDRRVRLRVGEVRVFVLVVRSDDILYKLVGPFTSGKEASDYPADLGGFPSGVYTEVWVLQPPRILEVSGGRS